MTVTLELPDEIARRIAAEGDLSRRVLESLAVDGYRREVLSQLQVGELLCLSRIEAEDFLAQHVDLNSYDPSELEREAVMLREFSERLQRSSR